MDTIQIRGDIDKYLDQADEGFLSIVHAMLKTYVQQKEQQDVIIGYRMDGQPLKAAEAKKEFAQTIEEMENGDYVSFENLQKEERVLNIVAKEQVENDGKGILKFAGVMSNEEAAEMYDSLGDTENIDEDGW